MFDIFENPFALSIAAVAAFIILLMLRNLLTTKKYYLLLIIPILLAAAAFAFDYLVQTDPEKIRSLIKKTANALENEDINTLETLISQNYRDSYHKTKKTLMRHLKYRLSKPLFKKNIARIIEKQISPPNATVTFTIRALFDERSFVYQSYKQQIFAKLKATLQNHNDKWLINRFELLELDLQPVTWSNIAQESW